MSKIRVAKRLNQFNEYVFSKLGKEVEEVEKQSGRKVLNFGQGNPDFPPSTLYINKLCEFIKNHDSHQYPGFGANDQFTDALISWYKKRFGVNLEKEELFPLIGAKDGVSHLPLALLDEGDEVLVPDPGYPAFTDPALMIGAKPVYYDLVHDNDFKISLNKLEKKISNRTKFIWINFPSNPTGQVVTLEELEKIVKFAKKHNLIIVYDNAYSEITFDGFIAPSILQIHGAKDITVELGSFSKTFSFAGFRIGWIVGNSKIIAALAKVKSQMDSGLSTPLQKLGAFALTHFDKLPRAESPRFSLKVYKKLQKTLTHHTTYPAEDCNHLSIHPRFEKAGFSASDYKNWYQHMITNYQQRRNTIASHLKKLGLNFSLPTGALYIWARIPETEKSCEEFCMKLLREKQILLTPGTAFGKNGSRFVRVSICANIENIEEYF